MHHVFNIRFERMRDKYAKALGWCLHHRVQVSMVYGVFVLGSVLLIMAVGTDFFPTIDSGQMRLHVRAPEGLRIEETEQVFSRVEETIRASMPPGALSEVIDNIGLPPGGFNLAFGDSATVGSSDGEILLSLNPEAHLAVPDVQRNLRALLSRNFPDESFFFQAANITNQILNFGIPAPIDVQVTGRDQAAAYKLAKILKNRLEVVPGAVDVHIRQEMNSPAIDH